MRALSFKNIYGKIAHWFEVIKEVLQDPAVQLDPRSRVTAY
jgi:hypothetical protein